MSFAIVLVVLAALAFGAGLLFTRFQAVAKKRQLDDALAEARRWVERLAGQVMHLTGTNAAAKQALADASERYTAAGSQLDLARTVEQAGLAKETALEGLYYIRAARVAMDLDPGPALPTDAERARAGAVTEHRKVEVEGETYEASPRPGHDTPHYYPGGQVAGRSVPEGWYNRPWWKSALIGGAWGAGAAVLFGSLFVGMAGVAAAQTWQDGFEAGGQDVFAPDDVGFDDAWDF
ncbi:hypothetical protein [Amycolatopsis orientalis]|uniref:hypothetical protein n=1 Tax=Amycolatopsis orientalis TaxID=31958 RepID=UPI0005CEAB66|nr:hypothetical protein [Amycolatopsis orientalis]